ncbi:MAPEG family protein [Rhizobiaceae bacterium n13]|uniref:MAPEG family protein n=1 Tax=Ferirhizobium litorale TaxID=2927786 RepID=A0AAE3U1J7_9HYPH|nr:MAPEG family protein [Fererhizobium litorale]MDI7861526.1 MAPEG family protein [Fererhizobium litorale]MDI7921672.1 MAPEG family protein [Fererhizobium litorale]
MTPELSILAALAVITLILPVVYSALFSKQVGQAVLSSNRENAPEPTGAAGRLKRAHANLIENLVPFAAVVLVAHAAGVSNTITIAGAWIFLAARLTHIAVYFAGITGIRTVAYFVSLLGSFMIASQIWLG